MFLVDCDPLVNNIISLSICDFFCKEDRGWVEKGIWGRAYLGDSWLDFLKLVVGEGSTGVELSTVSACVLPADL